MIRRGHLFRKYVVIFASLVSGALLASGLIEASFSYQDHKTALVALQREKALAAAAKIEQFIKDIERQIGWASQPVGARATLEQRRLDYLRLGLDRHGVPLSIVRLPNDQLTVEARAMRGDGLNVWVAAFTLDNPQGERREVVSTSYATDTKAELLQRAGIVLTPEDL